MTASRTDEQQLSHEEGRASRQKSTIAFVILTWNSEKYIGECLESLAAIEGFNVEVHVVDNGSTDGTLAIAKSIPIEGLHLYEQPSNLGTTVSRNIALQHVSPDADYICILDSDTVVNEDALQAMCDALDSNPSIGLIGPRMHDKAGIYQMSGRAFPTVGQKLGKAFPSRAIQQRAEKKETPDSLIVDGLQKVDYLLSACWLMKRSLLDEIGLLDENIFYAPEDVDYCARVNLAGYDVVLCHEADIVHDYQRISKRKLISRMNLEHLKGLWYYFRKYGYYFDARKMKMNSAERSRF